MYFDCNATTPIDARVLKKILPFFSVAFGNSSSRDHAFGWDAAIAVEEARGYVADLVNAKPTEILFTSCATESVSLALKGLGQKRGSFFTATTEHDSVLEAYHHLEVNSGLEVTYLAVERTGHIDERELSRCVRHAENALVSLMLANNETGIIHGIEQLAERAHASGSFFFSDLTQAAGKIPIDVRALGIDLAAFSAHKIYGPKGVGALYIRGGEPKIELEPLIVGGGQERGLRGGTLNVPGIVGFGEACRIAKLEMAEESARVGRLRDKLENTLLDEVPNVWVNGDRGNRLYNTSHLGFGGVDARTLIRDMHDIAVSTRSACSSGNQGPSHVLKAMGLTDEQAFSCVRFSLGRFTTEEEIDYTIRKVIASVIKLRRH